MKVLTQRPHWFQVNKDELGNLNKKRILQSQIKECKPGTIVIKQTPCSVGKSHYNKVEGYTVMNVYGDLEQTPINHQDADIYLDLMARG